MGSTVDGQVREGLWQPGPVHDDGSRRAILAAVLTNLGIERDLRAVLPTAHFVFIEPDVYRAPATP
jgi:hypothetical protein